MAGPNVLLGPQNTHFAKEHSQIMVKSGMPCLAVDLPTYRTFLDSCYLCRKRLSHGKDIYIYRGDRAFCTEECRNKHIVVDDEDKEAK